MPSKCIRPSTVIVTNTAGEPSHITITLELNINLNSNGIQASITGAETTKLVNEEDPEKEFEFAIPEFDSNSKTIDFGKKVDNV